MRKIPNAGLIKRDISFPIYFRGETIIASPGDTLISAILANKPEISVPSYFYNDGANASSAISSAQNWKIDELLYLKAFLQQEVYPGFVCDTLAFDKSRGFRKFKPRNFILGDDFRGFHWMRHLFQSQWFKSNFKPLIKEIGTEVGAFNCSGEEEALLFDDLNFVSVELLVVGAGVAGLVAALTCARAGMEVLLLESDFILGGRLNDESRKNVWVEDTVLELKNLGNVKIYTRTQLLKRDGEGRFLAIEKSYTQDKQRKISSINRFLNITANHAFIATGARERIPLNLNKNLPGMMSTGFLNRCLNRFGLGPNDGVTLYTNNDSGWSSVRHLTNLGLRIDAVIDTRPDARMIADCPVFRGTRVIDFASRSQRTKLIVRDFGGRQVKISTSLLAVSAGYNANFEVIKDNVKKLIWCPINSSFIAQVSSTDLTLLGGANALFCPKKAVENAYAKACELVQEKGMKIVSANFPKLDWNGYTCQPLTYGDSFYQIGSKKLAARKRNGYSLFQGRGNYPNRKYSRVDRLKLDALKAFSNDSREVDLIKKITDDGAEETAYEKVFFKIDPSLYILPTKMENLSKPFQALAGHYDYQKLGASFGMVGDWLVPDYFLNEETSSRKVDIYNFEVKNALKSVAISDMSDMAKIEVLGNDAGVFIHKNLSFNSAELELNDYQEGCLIDETGAMIDQIAILRIDTNKYILTTSSYSERRLYNFLMDRSLKNQPGSIVEINLITDFYCSYFLCGPSANHVLNDFLDLNSKSLHLRKTKIKTINSKGIKYIICHASGTIPAFRIFIPSSQFKQSFSRIFKSVLFFKGSIVGRSAAEAIELENGLISPGVLENFSSVGKSKNSLVDSTNKKASDNLLRFECLRDFRRGSRLAILHPIGPTKNIVVGSEVQKLEGPIRSDILGKVLVGYFSKVHGKFLGYVLLKKFQNFKRKPVIVMNLGKNYITECELSSFNFPLGHD